MLRLIMLAALALAAAGIAFANTTDRDAVTIDAVYTGEVMSNVRGGIKTGLIDLNSEFDTKDTGSLFINSAHGIGTEFSQTGRNGPSIFPSTSLAVRADAALGNGLTVRVGFFDAVPNDPDDQARG